MTAPSKDNTFRKLVLFYHFFYFFRYLAPFKKKCLTISFFHKKINYFKFFFYNVFNYLKAPQFKNIQLSKEKIRFLSQQTAVKNTPNLKANFNFLGVNPLHHNMVNIFHKFYAFQGVFFFPKYGRNKIYFTTKPRKNLVFKNLTKFF